MPTSDKLKAQRQKWEETTLKKVISRNPESKTEFTTSSWLPVERTALPEITSDDEYLEKLGFPGEFPFTRGVQPTMYRGRLWTMRNFESC